MTCVFCPLNLRPSIFTLMVVCSPGCRIDLLVDAVTGPQPTWMLVISTGTA
jgi:hypothetical protein